MATLREVLDSILTLAREERLSPQQPTITEDYHLLVLAMINEIKEEIEETHNWRNMRTTVDVTVSSGGNRAELTGTNGRSRLLTHVHEQQGGYLPLLHDLTEPSNPRTLKLHDLNSLIRLEQMSTSTTSTPHWAAIDVKSTDILEVFVYPTVSRDVDVRGEFFVPQDRLTASDLDTEILIPRRPLELGVLWYIFEERGEELGANAIYTQKKFQDALSNAVATDKAESGGMTLIPY